jgi:hypothetical protein
VDLKVEAIGKKRLEHELKLIGKGIRGRFGENVEFQIA